MNAFDPSWIVEKSVHSGAEFARFQQNGRWPFFRTKDVPSSPRECNYLRSLGDDGKVGKVFDRFASSNECTMNSSRNIIAFIIINN